MKLLPSTAETGLWVNSDWKEGTPGTFAMVIGVSAYDHLNGSKDAHYLQSLEVSALTAFRFFQWLGSDYYVEGCPIARCWLLLSPTAAELAVEPDLLRHAIAPTFAHCQLAIGAWATTMSGLPPGAARQSRGMFFFSGHGFEMMQGNQLLLPSDYLSPPVRNWNNAISTTNLAYGLASRRVPLQLFFVDACRNAPSTLSKKKVTGVDILPEDNNETTPGTYLSPILHATSSGQRAFQQPTPDCGLSLFGQALLDGVAGKPDLDLKQTATSQLVNLFPLQAFTKARVTEALMKARERNIQPVVLTGQVDDVLVAELGHLPGGPSGPGPGATPKTSIPGAPLAIAAATALAADAEGKAAGSTERASPSGPRSEWVTDSSRAHDVFGSESATEIWADGLALVSVSDGLFVPDPNAIAVDWVEHDGHGDLPGYWRVQLTIQHDDPFGHCLGLKDHEGNVWTTVLPSVSRSRQTVYGVEFELERHHRPEHRPLTRVETSLTGTGRLAVEFWRMYRFASLDATLEALRAFVTSRHAELQQAPFAAVIGGLIALRLGDTALANRFGRAARRGLPESYANQAKEAPPWRADWIALMAECKARRYDPATDAPPKANIGLLMAAEGIPCTTLGLLAARSAVHTLLGGTARLPTERVSVLEEVSKRLAIATESLAGEGMFATFAHLPPRVVASLLQRHQTSRPHPPIERDMEYGVKLERLRWDDAPRVRTTTH